MRSFLLDTFLITLITALPSVVNAGGRIGAHFGNEAPEEVAECTGNDDIKECGEPYKEKEQVIINGELFDVGPEDGQQYTPTCVDGKCKDLMTDDVDDTATTTNVEGAGGGESVECTGQDNAKECGEPFYETDGELYTPTCINGKCDKHIIAVDRDINAERKARRMKQADVTKQRILNQRKYDPHLPFRTIELDENVRVLEKNPLNRWMEAGEGGGNFPGKRRHVRKEPMKMEHHTYHDYV